MEEIQVHLAANDLKLCLFQKSKQEKKTKHQKSAIDFRKTSNGWAEFLSINGIPFLFQIATQNETVPFLKLNIFSFQH